MDGAILRDINLRGADLSRADLTGADLFGAYLEMAVLDGAIIKDANLRGANLRWCRLDRVNFDGSELTHINAACATFREAYIPHSALQLLRHILVTKTRQFDDTTDRNSLMAVTQN